MHFGLQRRDVDLVISALNQSVLQARVPDSFTQLPVIKHQQKHWTLFLDGLRTVHSI